MTSLTQRKTPCATCEKPIALFMCRGCERDFCMRHANEHRQELGKQMDELTLDYDQCRAKLIEDTASQSPHYFQVKQNIDQWERESIEKIHQVADSVRQNLEDLTRQHSTKLTDTLNKIVQEINESRKEDQFFETDIQVWMQQLEKLKNDLAKAPAFGIQQSDGLVPFIGKINLGVYEEVFGRMIGKLELVDEHRVVVHSQPNEHATVRGDTDYSCGVHRLRLKVEQCCSSKWIFVGIVSKYTLLETISIKSPSVYGWAGPNQVYLNGVYYAGFNNYQNDVEKDDVLELLINCDDRRIRLMNERTRSAYELDIDVRVCPFPWQLNLNLYFFGDRIRLLSTQFR